MDKLVGMQHPSIFVSDIIGRLWHFFLRSPNLQLEFWIDGKIHENIDEINEMTQSNYKVNK